MANSWRKAMTYLGLGPDEEYEDYDAGYDEPPAREQPAPRQAPPPRQAPAQRPVPAQDPGRPAGRPRPAPGRSAAPPPTNPFSTSPPDGGEPPSVRTLPAPGDDSPKPRVRAVPRTPQAKPHLVTPASFNQAQEVADRFKASQPVALDLGDADRDLSRRLIDFCSGLCYGLGGHMEKVAGQLYLLTPAGVEVAPEERRRLGDTSLADA
jgi:cell division inhibitor SepF